MQIFIWRILLKDGFKILKFTKPTKPQKFAKPEKPQKCEIWQNRKNAKFHSQNGKMRHFEMILKQCDDVEFSLVLIVIFSHCRLALELESIIWWWTLMIFFFLWFLAISKLHLALSQCLKIAKKSHFQKLAKIIHFLALLMNFCRL